MIESHLIRQTIPDDAPTIAAIHVETWRTAYADLVPASELAALSVERREAFWRRAITGRPESVAVCSHGDEVAGFISFGASRDEDSANAGEIYAVYVRPACWGRGCGHRLLEYALDALRKRGHNEATLWVLDGNERAIRFYAAHGFAADGAVKEEAMMGVTLREQRRRFVLR